MRIKCPFCGERSLDEFTYYGDATVLRPNPSDADAVRKFTEYVYLRDNKAGAHQELWYHHAGCRAWLKVTRDTNTHLIDKITATAKPGTDKHGTTHLGESA